MQAQDCNYNSKVTIKTTFAFEKRCGEKGLAVISYTLRTPLQDIPVHIRVSWILWIFLAKKIDLFFRFSRLAHYLHRLSNGNCTHKIAEVFWYQGTWWDVWILLTFFPNSMLLSCKPHVLCLALTNCKVWFIHWQIHVTC